MSWKWPALVNRIASDVPFIQKALNALLKQDPTSIEDIPAGAKRLTEVSSRNWQVQQYNGTSWNNIGKLKMDVDTVDSYHAAITPTANTIAVRNKQSKLEGDITGNAATASSAVTLSEALAVNKGGTGATTSAGARTNLGVPPTSHASATTTYGVATDTNYGHVRSDGKTTNISSGEIIVKDVAIGGNIGDLASTRGQIGNAKYKTITDFNSLNIPGVYWVGWGDTVPENAPPNEFKNSSAIVIVSGTNTGASVVVRQVYFRNINADSNARYMYVRHMTTNGYSSWFTFLNTQLLGDGFYKGTNGVVSVPEYQGATSDLNGIAGLVPPAAKGQHDYEFLRGDGEWTTPRMLVRKDVSDTAPSSQPLVQAITPGGTNVGFIKCFNDNTFGYGIAMYAASSSTAGGLYAVYDPKTNKFKTFTTASPEAASNSSELATTKWVRDRLTGSGGLWKALGNRGTVGAWTITGVRVGVPLFIICTRNTITEEPQLSFTNECTGFTSPSSALYGARSTLSSGNALVVIPTATSVKLDIAIIVAFTLYAYQQQ